jgi:hypothetical protein
MSRHILYNLFPFLKSFIKTNASPNILTVLGTSVVLTYGHGMFALATNKKEKICVTKKYTYVANGYTNFMIVDDNGRHFNVNNSFWYWKWDAIEEWNNIQEQLDEKKDIFVVVSYYGYRIPFLGLFPNLVHISTQLDKEINIRIEKGDILKHIHV